MINRRHSGLVASLLAFSLMACTGSPLGAGNDKDGRPGGTGGTPAAPTATPIKELEIVHPEDEATEPPLTLSWAMKEHDSPRNQRVDAVIGAPRLSGGYRFFLRQADRFYYRDTGQYAPDTPHGWDPSRVLPSVRDYKVTNPFSDGDRLFFVHDPDIGSFADNRIYAWQGASWVASGPPGDIRAVAGGRGVAFAATQNKLHVWNGASWSEVASIGADEAFVSLSLDTERGDELVALVYSSDSSSRYQVRLLKPGATKFEKVSQTTEKMVSDPPLKLFRSYLNPSLNLHNFWAFSRNQRLWSGEGSFGTYDDVPNVPSPFDEAFNGLTLFERHFYAFRRNRLFRLRDTSQSSQWEELSPVPVELMADTQLSTDGTRLYVGGVSGLHQVTLNAVKTEPWVRESVELNREEIHQVTQIGKTLYARTPAGATFRQAAGKWEPFLLGGQLATLHSSYYGQVATVSEGTGLSFYGLANGQWQPMSAFPSGWTPDTSTFFFAKDSVFIAAKKASEGEAVFRRSYGEASEWTRALPPPPPSLKNEITIYYATDGRVVFAATTTKVLYAPLASQIWAEYPKTLILADGKHQPLPLGTTFERPFGMHGYVFCWLRIGGEYRLCRATPEGWSVVALGAHQGAEVSRGLSSDGAYLYTVAKPAGSPNTQYVLRVPLKGGSAWEDVKATIPALTIHAPPFIQRATREIFFPTSLGIWWNGGSF